MKFNKKVLIGLLTATCAVAGTFGLAACQDKTPTEKPEVTIGENGNVFVNGVDTGIAAKPEGDGVTVSYVLQVGNKVTVYYSDGTSQEVPFVNTDLSAGANVINLPLDALATGTTYKFAPGKAGDYFISVAGDNAKVTVGNETVSGTYVAKLEKDDDVLEIKCATVNGKAGSYTINVNPVTVLLFSNVSNIVLPRKGTTAYYCVNVESSAVGAYTFNVGFNGNDAKYDYTFTVNGKAYPVGGYHPASFGAILNEGENLIAVTSALQADSSATLSFTAIPSGGTLTVGDNNLSFEKADTFYAYTFTPTEDGDYSIAIPAGINDNYDIVSTLKVQNAEGDVIVDVDTSDPNEDNVIVSASFEAKANEQVLLLVMADCGSYPKLESYKLSINKYVPPTISATENSDIDNAAEITVNENGSKVLLNVETAGTYVLNIEFSRMAYNEVISLGDHQFLSSDNSSLTLELTLEAGDNLVEFVYESAGWDSSITVFAYLAPKA